MKKGNSNQKLVDKQKLFEQSKQFNIPVAEIIKGLWPAIEEFLNDNPEWKLIERYTNNNGLTILKRI